LRKAYNVLDASAMQRPCARGRAAVGPAIADIIGHRAVLHGVQAQAPGRFCGAAARHKLASQPPGGASRLDRQCPTAACAVLPRRRKRLRGAAAPPLTAAHGTRQG